MKHLHEIVIQFKNKELDSFIFKEKISTYYKKSEKSDEIKSETLKIIEDNIKNESNDSYMWRCFFESDRSMSKQISLLENKIMAEQCYNDNINEPSSSLLKMSVSLAHTMCENKETYIFDKDKEDIWIKSFYYIPEFKTLLENKKQYWINWRKESNATHNIQSTEPMKVIIESYQITVPIEIKRDDNNQSFDANHILVAPEFITLVSELTQNFNDFALEKYMDSFENCLSSSAIFSKDLLFTFDFCEKLTIEQLEKCKEDFIGQLSDGWGENASQKIILLDKTEISIDFVLEKVDSFTIVNKKKIKP